MGIRSTLQLLKLGAQVTTAATSPGGPAPTAMLSPWQEGSLAPIVWSDVFGIATVPLTRHEAMRVPAVAKARAILHAIITPRPLRAMRGAEFLEDDQQPTWLYRSDTGIAPQMRTAEILDDIIFNEASLLVVQRGAPSPGAAYGPILDAVHCPYDRWFVDDDGRIRIDDELAPADSVVVIYGPGPGLLVSAAETIRAARDMQAAWAERVRTPLPSMVLREQEEGRIGDEKKQEYVNAIAAARRKPGGGVMLLPFGIDGEFAAPNDDAGLFIEGRNALRLDIANFFNLPAALLDGSVSAASLTYSTQEGRRNELFDYGLGYWTGPIENALSLDNVCPRGQRIRIDFTDLMAAATSATGPTTED